MLKLQPDVGALREAPDRRGLDSPDDVAPRIHSVGPPASCLEPDRQAEGNFMGFPVLMF